MAGLVGLRFGSGFGIRRVFLHLPLAYPKGHKGEGWGEGGAHESTVAPEKSAIQSLAELMLSKSGARRFLRETLINHNFRHPGIRRGPF